MTAVFNRWNAAGLNSSIAKLYPGGQRSSSRNQSGSPQGSTIPRAQYRVFTPRPQALSRGSRIYQAAVEIETWGASELIAAGFVTAIKSAFINSDNAATSPMVMADGTVMQVEDEGSNVSKDDDDMHCGRQLLSVRFRVNNSTPG